MKRWFFALCVTASTWCLSAELPLSARAAYVIDEDTDQVLYERDSTSERPIASVTKLMTALVTVDANLPADEDITITADDANVASIHGKQTGTSLPVGITLPRSTVLRLALMNSQNRAAAALGRTYPGGMTAFVDAMNAKAISLGMLHTHYVEPTGLNRLNVSTAKDLAVLTRAAAAVDAIRAYSTTSSYTVIHKAKLLTFRTTNPLVMMPEWNVVAQKTGYTEPAGRCMTLMTTVSERRVIIVLLHAIGQAERQRDATIIKHWISTGEVLQPTVPAVKPRKRTHRRR